MAHCSGQSRRNALPFGNVPPAGSGSFPGVEPESAADIADVSEVRRPTLSVFKMACKRQVALHAQRVSSCCSMPLRPPHCFRALPRHDGVNSTLEAPQAI